DAGAWEKLDEAQRLPGFGHELVWRTGGEMVVGRLWSSRDGKGRTKYPMAVVAHCACVPAAWIESVVMPRLAEVERACVTTESAAEVRRIVDQAREDLRAALPAEASALGGVATPAELAALALTTSVPYSMDPHFVAHCDASIAAWKEGRATVGDAPDAGAPPTSDAGAPGGALEPQKKRRPWIFWGGSAGAVVVAVAGFFI